MKKTTLIIDSIEYYFNFFGFKREKPVKIEETVVTPESLDEELEVTLLYHQIRRNFLIKLHELDKSIDKLDREIDAINKSQIASVLPWARLNDRLIKKSELSRLMNYVDDMINLIEDKEIHLPMKDMEYLMLINFNHYFSYANDTFQKIKESVNTRALQLNVTL